MVQRCCFALLLLSALLSGAGCRVNSLRVAVVAADTQLPVAGATVTLSKGQMALPPQTTDDSGQTTFQPAPPGKDDIAVSAAGYADASTTVSADPGLVSSVRVALTRTAPALVFHTFSGSTANPAAQAASVQVSLGSQSVFTGSTTTVGNPGYDAVTVPNLKPSATYTYTVSASGFASITGTKTTNADATATEVDVLLLPPTVNVEVQTSVLSPGAAGSTMGSAAVVTITAPDGTITTVTTLNPPVGPTNASYDLASPPTVPLAPNTTYQYSALFTQYGGAPGNPVTGTITPQAGSANSGPFVKSIVYDPAAGRTSSTPSKALP
jgi:hypothetical protein